MSPEPGDQVFIRGTVVEYRAGVGACVELFSKTDQYQAWVRPDLLASKGSVVLDLRDGQAKELADYLCGCDMKLSVGDRTTIARAIRKQTKPQRIPEPGLWGVVAARLTDECQSENKKGPHAGKYIHATDGTWSHIASGYGATWNELHDPVLIRKGIKS